MNEESDDIFTYNQKKKESKNNVQQKTHSNYKRILG